MNARLKVLADMLREEGMADVAEWLGRPELMREALKRSIERDHIDADASDVLRIYGLSQLSEPINPVMYVNPSDYAHLQDALGYLTAHSSRIQNINVQSSPLLKDNGAYLFQVPGSEVDE
jgi:hypothetical protein